MNTKVFARRPRARGSAKRTKTAINSRIDLWDGVHQFLLEKAQPIPDRTVREVEHSF